MNLSPHETGSALWQKLEAHLNERLAKHRARLETRLIEADTVRLRGQIAEIREFLAMGQPERETETDAG